MWREKREYFPLSRNLLRSGFRCPAGEPNPLSSRNQRLELRSSMTPLAEGKQDVTTALRILSIMYRALPFLSVRWWILRISRSAQMYLQTTNLVSRAAYSMYLTGLTAHSAVKYRIVRPHIATITDVDTRFVHPTSLTSLLPEFQKIQFPS